MYKGCDGVRLRVIRVFQVRVHVGCLHMSEHGKWKVCEGWRVRDLCGMHWGLLGNSSV